MNDSRQRIETGNRERLSEFRMELKLLVNQRLFDKGHITEEMYIKAKKIILGACNPQGNSVLW